ncbi:hypothetical protein [Gordonia sp. NPDC003422]
MQHRKLGSQRSLAALARLERTFQPEQATPAVVVVIPLDQRTATSPFAAALAVLLESVLPHPVCAVDTDGTAQPLRRLLKSSGAGDLVGLAASHDATLRRRSVENYVDMAAEVPLASCWLDGPGAFPPNVFRDAVWKLRRRFPTLVLDVPQGVPRGTINVACELASHVVLVGDSTDIGHEWLHEGKSVLATLAARHAVTVVAVGGHDDVRTACAHCAVTPTPPMDVGSSGGSARTALTASSESVIALSEVALRAITSPA